MSFAEEDYQSFEPTLRENLGESFCCLSERTKW